MKRKILIGLILSSIVLFVRACNGYKNQTADKPDIKVSVPIKKEKGTIGKKEDSQVDEDDSSDDVYVPPEGKITITPKDPTKTIDEVINVKVDWYGRTFHPGLRMGLLPLSPGIDFKLYFIGRLGFELGVGTTLVRQFDQSPSFDGLSPTVGMSYRLDRVSWLQNSEVAFVYQPLLRVPYSIGLRWNF